MKLNKSTLLNMGLLTFETRHNPSFITYASKPADVAQNITAKDFFISRIKLLFDILILIMNYFQYMP